MYSKFMMHGQKNIKLIISYKHKTLFFRKVILEFRIL